jgi:4'-phosphopantetheinyl transferase EntD
MPAPGGDLAAGLAPRLPPGIRIGWHAVGALLPDPRDGAHLGAAVPRRQMTFAAGRAAARMALGRDVPLPAGADRRPVWPEGTAGSITHTDVLALALTAEARAFRSLAIDAEIAGRVQPHLCETLFHPEDMAGPTFDATAAFAAKEALFKLLNPLTGVWFGFHAARVAITDGEVLLTLAEPVGPFPAGWQVTGPLVAAEGHVAAALWLPLSD